MVDPVRHAAGRVRRPGRVYGDPRRDAAAGHESGCYPQDALSSLDCALAGGILIVMSSPPLAAWLGACLAAPAIAMALTLTAVEAYRLAAPEAPLFGGPAPATLTESIVEGFGVEQTYQFIGQGQDPNAPIPVDDAEYTGGGTVQVSPLMLAVAANDG